MSAPTRLRPVPGGWVLARDLADAPRLPDRRLAQHQVAAHSSWGCSAGLLVMVADGEVVVTPGCAVDRCGRTVVLARTARARLVPGRAVAVVLRRHGAGPAGRVHLRDAGAVQELDVPLSSVDAQGTVRDGDTDRRWLRRPGPTLRLAGTVPRGSVADGTYSAWTAHVDLARHRLPDTPAVVAAVTGRTGGGDVREVTVEVAQPSAAGFDLVVRDLVHVGAVAVGDVLRTAPRALTWLAVLPAERPDFPPEQEWS
jgi:hypothetical protein